MPILDLDLLATIQTSSPGPQGGFSTAAGYVAFAMVAAILALVVVMFVRTSTGSKR